MTASAQHHRGPVPAASTFDAEAFIYEQLGFICLHAGMAQTYLEAGDNPGFRYSLASLVARVKAVAGVFNDISAPVAKEEARNGL